MYILYFYLNTKNTLNALKSYLQ